MRRMRAMVDMAERRRCHFGAMRTNVIIYGEKTAECRDLLDAIASPNFRAIFDFANFVQAGVRPLAEGWELLKDDIDYFHISGTHVCRTGRSNLQAKVMGMCERYSLKSSRRVGKVFSHSNRI